MKISNYTIGNRTRDLPACNAVPQPTVPPRREGGRSPPKNRIFKLYSLRETKRAPLLCPDSQSLYYLRNKSL